jgi:glycosyltransferase involved in cell wall biosynthesis
MGKDLFVQLARTVVKMCSKMPIVFIWVGEEKGGKETAPLRDEIKKYGLQSRVFLLPHVANPLDYYADFNMFTMVSREDPFPLVNLEVAVLRKPILCFANSGGSEEFVEDDAGFVVPPYDVEAMAKKVIQLAEDEQLRESLGRRAYEKVIARHDVSIAANEILQIMKKCLSNN